MWHDIDITLIKFEAQFQMYILMSSADTWLPETMLLFKLHDFLIDFEMILYTSGLKWQVIFIQIEFHHS